MLSGMEVDDTTSSDSWECKAYGIGDLLKYVYREEGTQSMGQHGMVILDTLTLENLDDYIDGELEASVSNLPSNSGKEGRLGPQRVIFDVSSNVGSLVIDKDRLGLTSQSNFSSIRANCCFYKGKWQYELMLGSKGVMQVGWATINCKFSQEKGVGDTPDSYAYDGNRIRKWNVAAYKYGEAWLTGDVIGCTIDLHKGHVHFYRNGHWLGEAFNLVRIGPGLAYFPAVSLAYNENVVANFGAIPLRYPVEGFEPLEYPPVNDIKKAEKLLSWLERILTIYCGVRGVEIATRSPVFEFNSWPHIGRQWTKAQVLLVTVPLMHRLGPLLTSAYVTEACLLPLFFKICDESTGDTQPKQTILALLDIMWALLESHELHLCLEHLIVALLTGYRFSPTTADFCQQKRYLRLTLSILQHTPSRRYLLQNILFDKIKFPVFLQVKPLDNAVLSHVVPLVWVDTGQQTLDAEELSNKEAYIESCQQIKTVVKEVENLQLEILIQLFKKSDVEQGQSSRSLFLSKFRDFLKENSGGSRVPVVHLCPLPVTLPFFHHLVSLLRCCLQEMCLVNPHNENLVIPSTLYVPVQTFCDNSINYIEIQHVGGLHSHLQKTLHAEVAQTLRQQGTNMRGPSLSGFQATEVDVSTPQTIPSQPPLEKDDYSAIIELVDGVIRLYQIAAHRQLEKMCSLRDSMQEYVTALQETEQRLHHCEREVIMPLLQAKKVFLEKLTEQARHQAWITAVIYSPEKQADVYWIFQVLLRTLSLASSHGALFAFVPDFYVESCIKTCNALRSIFPPVSNLEELPDYQDSLIQYGTFLAEHFADSRVVNAELKDSLVQALAAYVCYPATLQAMESMPISSRMSMIKALLQPYENRAWAQSNWILVRLWKGCGFAFRYTMPPHLAKRLNSKPQQLAETSGHQKPCPSLLFQQHVAEWLQDNPEPAAAFLGSVLSQLNWAFSEFIGMLQEIQNASNRSERVFIDSRQLKICATCFDLALALLRVLEMVVDLVPRLFTDWSRPSAEIFLTRLCQLMCQVLNRVTSRSGCFYLVVSMEIPGLETVDHFPILAAVAGILISLVLKEPSQSRECAVVSLLNEPSFQPSSLDFLLGTGPSSQPSRQAESPYIFNFKDYEEVSELEIQQVEQLVKLLQDRHKMALQAQGNRDIDEEEICTICYATPKSANFLPCGHQSCRSCICLHLLQHRDCFFCKAVIERVESVTGEVLYPTGTK